QGVYLTRQPELPLRQTEVRMKISKTTLSLGGVGIALLFAATVGSTVAGQSPGAQPCLKGVWRAAEIRYIGANARTVSNPPWIVVFTDKHVASVGVSTDTPRRELPPADKRTDKDLADAFRGLGAAYAGTYDVSGGEFTRTNIVAANPNNMRAV